MKILMLDDNEITLARMAELLASRGHEVRVAAGGGAALAELERERPDVFVSDMVMPGVSGAEVVRLAREATPGLPVVVTTALPESEMSGAGLPPGMAFLRKQFTVEELEAAMQAAVGGPSDAP